MKLYKTVKRKQYYLDNRSGCIQYDLNKDLLFCVLCEKPFMVKDYLVRLEFEGSKMKEVISCANPECDGHMDYWADPYVALGILKDLNYDEMNEKTKEYYRGLTIAMENLLKKYEDENKEN